MKKFTLTIFLLGILYTILFLGVALSAHAGSQPTSLNAGTNNVANAATNTYPSWATARSSST
jgi:hypothetical protein